MISYNRLLPYRATAWASQPASVSTASTARPILRNEAADSLRACGPCSDSSLYPYSPVSAASDASAQTNRQQVVMVDFAHCACRCAGAAQAGEGYAE